MRFVGGGGPLCRRTTEKARTINSQVDVAPINVRAPARRGFSKRSVNENPSLGPENSFKEHN